MNSRDKALRFKRLMPCEFDDEDVEDLIKLLDQHAEEARAEQAKKCGYKAAQYLSEEAEGFVSDLNAENAASEILRVCLNAVEKSDE